ncbi:MAG TPA: TolC family protein [Kiritimatiellia bacterium]|nr:TolC family protein [Kiritimatiellia bacterium]
MTLRVNWRLIPIAGLGLLLAAACQTTSRYERPELDVPDTWQTLDSTEPTEDRGAALRNWWGHFNDPELTALIDLALTNSLTLHIAFLRIEEAMALRGVAAGDRMPAVNGSGAGQTARLSDAEGGAARESRSTEIYRVGLDASWEIDLWGRIRQSVRAADAAIGIATEDYHDTLVILAGEVARQYFLLRELHQRLIFLSRNIEAQNDTLRMTRGRYENGLAPALDVHQAEVNLNRSMAAMAPLQIQVHAALNRLAVLTGQPPGAVTVSPIDEWEEAIPDFGLNRGVPADLLTTRPDVRRAEQQLIAQTARLGVARTDVLPRISLSGTFALQADQVGDLGSSGALSYRLGPTFVWPLFQGGRIRSNIDAVESRVEQAILHYRQVVLSALEEVEGAWISYQMERDRYTILLRSVVAAERSVEQVRTLYENGLVPFLNVLDAERSLVDQHDQLAQSRGQIFRGIVQLHRALGHGWPTE